MMMLPALLLAAVCTPDLLFSPTPVVSWDQVADADLSGYVLYYREPGGVFQKLLDFPCKWFDLTEPPDGVADLRFCRGPDMGAPLQRYCSTCSPLVAYEFAVKAKNLAGVESTSFSNVLPVCFSPICNLATRGPCN